MNFLRNRRYLYLALGLVSALSFAGSGEARRIHDPAVPTKVNVEPAAQTQEAADAEACRPG